MEQQDKKISLAILSNLLTLLIFHSFIYWEVIHNPFTFVFCGLNRIM